MDVEKVVTVSTSVPMGTAIYWLWRKSSSKPWYAAGTGRTKK
jgi:hypothetical protein